MLSRFFYKHNQLLDISLLHFFAMSQHLSVSQPDLLKKLHGKIFKFKQHGPPIFRQNIPCKYGEHCKYGRYSCIYSHESICKFQKKNKSCLNRSCTHQHQLPLEYQLAEALFHLKTQFSGEPLCPDQQNSASERQFISNSSSQAARPNAQSFALK